MKIKFSLFILAAFLLMTASSFAWVQRANFFNQRMEIVTWTIGNYGYCTTGMGWGNLEKDLWRYDPVNDTWTQLADGMATLQASTGFTINGKGYVTCGAMGGSVGWTYEYDPVGNSWTQKNDCPVDRMYAAAFSIGSKGYVGTGNNSISGTLDDFWEFDPVANSWTQKASFSFAKVEGASGFSIGNKGYIACGGDFNNDYKELYEYDPGNNTWTAKANYGGNKRRGAAGFVIGTQLYLGNGSLNQDWWIWDQNTNVWTNANATFPDSRQYFTAGFAVSGRGFVVGGYDLNGPPQPYSDALYEFAAGANNGITTGAINPPTVCAGATVQVPFTITGNFNGANVFTAELSNSVGSFANPIAIGTLAGANAGTISGVIPANTSPSGSGYKIRVVASNPSTIGAASSITINALPVVSISGVASAYCINNAPVTLTGVPAGGTFSGNGVSGNVFTPAAAGNGPHTITYSYTDPNGCSGVATLNVTVNNIPTVSITGLNNAYILADPAATMTGNPPGGFFSGPGVSGNIFTAATAGVGTHTIVYIYNDGNGCSNAICQSVAVSQFQALEEHKMDPNGEIAVYPNPGNGKYTLTFDAGQQAVKIKVLNVVGQVIYEESYEQYKGIYNKTIDLSSFANGVYSLSLQKGNDVYQKSLVKGQ